MEQVSRQKKNFIQGKPNKFSSVWKFHFESSSLRERQSVVLFLKTKAFVTTNFVILNIMTRLESM